MMGRIKTQQIKRVTNSLMKEHGSDFKEDFNSNKELVSKFVDVKSKKLRNVIAGYVTRLSKTKDI
jgi:small subunit ribosomal protein S17e